MGFELMNHRRVFITTLLASLACLASLTRGKTGTSLNFYNGKCLGGESSVRATVRATITKHFNTDPTIAPKLLRLHFHDCFVTGCDASILLDGPTSEKFAIPNLSLQPAFPVIDEVKSQLEAICPGIVSCADILALAARDSVILTGGRGWVVPTGRRDGNVSLASNTISLPAPTDDVPAQIKKFSDKGLDVTDLVTLVGAHTIGFTGCLPFSYRLYNYNNTGRPDPSIDRSFLPTLRNLCPSNGGGAVRVPLDYGSETAFDVNFYRQINRSRGILESDQRLLANSLTNQVLQKYAGRGVAFETDFKFQFGVSMVKMGNIGVLTGTQGEIRNVCSKVNSNN